MTPQAYSDQNNYNHTEYKNIKCIKYKDSLSR